MRNERLKGAGLDAPLSAADIKRIYRERTGRDVPDTNATSQRVPDGAIAPAPIPKLPPIPIRRSDADVDQLTITVPAPPTLTNSTGGRSRHWWTVNAEKKRYWRRLDELQVAQLIPLPPRRAIGAGTLRSVMTIGGRMDEDNAFARHKWVIDWLATRGYLLNDRLLHWEAAPEQIIRRRATQNDEATIELTVTKAMTPP